ncbi:pentapeptide repeat-containing protein [Heyndrickxia sp. MSNUG]|uniref:pentapeptide repeat-containing protein n=1 Tax=Heyndrickxia sp. MSNUG TaxID=3136677 RepID=UPI003C2C5AEF
MRNQLKVEKFKDLRADCRNCFGLCCVALPYAKSVDFAFNKEGGTPCQNLQADFRCSIHKNLRSKGFKGCTVYECFGAGQKVSQFTYNGMDWRENPASAKEMFDVFPIMQQIHEMFCYLHAALSFVEAKPLHTDFLVALEKTKDLTTLEPSAILSLDIQDHRAIVNDLLLQTSEMVRSKVKNKNKRVKRGSSFIGTKMRRENLRGANLRGALMIAAELKEPDLRDCDFIGADLRDTDLSGANLAGSFFLTQAQINSAKGDKRTKLPVGLKKPDHW